MPFYLKQIFLSRNSNSPIKLLTYYVIALFLLSFQWFSFSLVAFGSSEHQHHIYPLLFSGTQNGFPHMSFARTTQMVCHNVDSDLRFIYLYRMRAEYADMPDFPVIAEFKLHKPSCVHRITHRCIHVNATQ